VALVEQGARAVPVVQEELVDWEALVLLEQLDRQVARVEQVARAV
jgi:hypothetical protein